MDVKLTRRGFAVALTAIPVSAQGPSDSTAPPDYDALSRAQIKQNSEQLAKASVSMSVEPSFVFKP